MPKLKFTLKAWPVIALATIGLNCLTGQLAKALDWPLPDQAQMEAVKAMIGWNLQFLVVALEVILIMPAIEEFLFRFPTRFFTRLRYWAWAVLSAVFSFAHYIDYQALARGTFALLPLNVAFIALFFFGLAQCWLYKKTNIGCAILNHGLFNATNLVLLLIVPESWQI